ncbi:MAG TPA: C1 family peptidase [Pyrinomonadaceae bacterium]
MSSARFINRGRFTAVKPFQVVLRAPQLLTSTPQVDLRPTIQSLNLAVRAQAPRGTCSVFAMTFLLEYMYGTRLAVTANDLSEEYLNYAANQVSGENGDGDFFDRLDAGYQKWGIVPEASVPYQSAQVASVPQGALDAGRLWTRFRVDFIKPWDSSKGASQSQLDQAVAYLDRNVPVAFGGWWPSDVEWGTTVVKGIEVMKVPAPSKKGTTVFDGHSVPLVGYRRDSAFAGGGYFVFRNSWGSGWGDNGYGYMPFDYVLKFANDLVAYTTKSITTTHIGTQSVVKQKDQLDVFVADKSGGIDGAAWKQSVLGGRWRGWWSILGGQSKPGAPVTVVARDANRLDLFVAGTDGKTYTAAWDRNVTNGQWRGWWNILTGAVPAGGAVSAVSRDPNKLDIFVVSNDGGVYTAAWDQNVSNAQWRGWWRVPGLNAKPGSQVACVARDPNKLDIFVAGNDGKVYTAAWDQNVSNGQWRGWWNIQTGNIPVGGTITAVSRAANKLDIFIVSNDGGIYTAAWDQNVSNAQWRGWWRVLGGVAAPGSAVAAVARDPNKLDIFVVGTDGGIYTAAWDQNVSNAQWRGWWRITNGVAAPGSGIAAVARDSNKLDVFVVGTDGAVWTAAWDQNVSNAQWRGWWRVES